MLGESTPEVSKAWVVSIYSENDDPAGHETLLKMSPGSAPHCFVEVAGRPQFWRVEPALPSRPVALAVPGARAAAYARVVSDVMRAVQCAP
jgi:hypothetical protein